MTGTIRELETHGGTVSLGEDQVVYVTLAANLRVDLPELEAVMGAHLEIAAGRAYPALIDLRNIRGMTRRALHGPADHAIQHCITRCALLTRSPVTTVFARFFVKIVAPIYPVKVFGDRDRAIAWLREDPTLVGVERGSGPR